MAAKNYVFTSEAVTEGHPDKVCDLISDAVLDEVMRKDKNGRVACETFITSGFVVVGGEISAKADINIQKLTENVLADTGYGNTEFGFGNFYVLNAIRKQSVEIAKGVDRGGAGDQGIMFGYATNETPELMPAPILWANKLAKYISYVRKNNIIGHLGPDGKTQLSLEYENGIPKRVKTVLVSVQHSAEALDKNMQTIERFKKEIIEKAVKPCLRNLIDGKTEIIVNPAGSFVIGGPAADTGLTGRKIMVDTYGGSAPHGGGAFSGKDPTKVDRSGAYATRYIAKNVVASGIASKCLIQLSYGIGIREPLSVFADTFGTSKASDDEIANMIKEVFHLTPDGIIQTLNLKNPIYYKTAAYGHFGRSEFPWEKTDRAEEVKDYFRSKGYSA